MRQECAGFSSDDYLIQKKFRDYAVKHYHFNLIDSTNTWAKENLNLWDKDGVTLVTAAEQTHGRGRFKREWFSPKNKNISATFCFFVNVKQVNIGQIPQLLALSIVQILENYHVSARLKWPNDVLVNGKKIAGILCETTLDNHRIGVVCGVGLNINMTIEEMVNIDQKATSLSIEMGKILDLNEVLKQLNVQFLQNWEKFLIHGFHPFFDSFQERFYHQVGQKMSINNGTEKIDGKFLQVKEDGSICILLTDGQIQTCLAGEIIQH